MPILDASNGHIDHNDVGANAALFNSDSFHWTILCNLPASGAQSAALVIQNATSIVALTKLLSIGHGGLETFYIRQDGSMGIGTGGLFPTSDGQLLTLRGQNVDGATSIAIRMGNTHALSTVGSKIAAFYNDSLVTEKLAVDNTGKLRVPTAGAAPVVGKAVLVGGTVTVSTTAVEANSIIFLTRGVTGGTIGDLRIGTITAGTSFTIVSASGTDTSTVNWWMVN